MLLQIIGNKEVEIIALRQENAMLTEHIKKLDPNAFNEMKENVTQQV